MSLKGKTIKLPVDVAIEPVFWDLENEMVKDLHPDADYLNMMIDRVRSRIFKVRKRQKF